MAIFAPAVHGGSTAYSISNSLRFDGVDDYLSRTFGTPTDAKKWVFSARMKRGNLSAGIPIFGAISGTNTGAIFTSSDTVDFAYGGNWRRTGTRKERDPSAHLHLVIVFDSANGTEQDRLIYYANGVRVTWATSTSVGLNDTTAWNSAGVVGYIGYVLSGLGANTYPSQILSDVYHVDGQSLPSGASNWAEAFGETNSDGVWVPKAYSGTYGNNGFHLDFSDGTSTTTLGYDTSGNANHWTLTGMTRAAGVNECWVTDTPTDNFAVANWLDKNASGTLGFGGLRWTAGAAQCDVRSSVPIPTTGKWYAKATVTTTTTASVAASFGLATADVSLSASNAVAGLYQLYFNNSGILSVNGSNITSSLGVATAGDVIRIAVDSDAGKLWLGKNATWYDSAGGTTGNPATGANATVSSLPAGLFLFSNCYQNTVDWNCGQYDAGSYGTPDASFKALSTANGAVVSIPDPSLDMDVVLDTGANIKSACEAVYGDGLYVIKDRANSNNWQWIDYVRGTSAVLQSNTTAAETTYSAPSGNSVGFCWKAGGTPTTDNVAGAGNVPTAGSVKIDGVNMSSALAGTIAATRLSANTVAGFSIVTYTGTGANATVAHGLGVAPKMVIVKARNGTGALNWPVYHASVGNTYYGYLNLTNAFSTASGVTIWNNTSPTTTVFSVGTDAQVNENTKNLVAYCFAEIPGYSKFGSFVGNNSADGWYLHLGFTPKYFLVKDVTTTGYWCVYDGSRSPDNVVDETLQAQSAGTESTLYPQCDFVAGGVKWRAPDATSYPNNKTTSTYIYMAIAEHPFGGSNVSPAPAR